MAKGKSFIIPYHIYPYDLMVSIGEDDKKLTKRLKKVLNKSAHYQIETLMEGSYEARAMMFCTSETIIRFRKIPNAGVVAHEVFHAICFLFRHIGVKLSDESDEAWAYLLEYVINEITSKLK